MFAPRISAPALLTLVLSAVTGCTGTTGHLAVASTRSLDLQSIPVGARQHVVGRSCIHLIVVVPTAMPNFGDAITDALQQAGGQVLTDVSIGYEIRYVPAERRVRQSQPS